MMEASYNITFHSFSQIMSNHGAYLIFISLQTTEYITLASDDRLINEVSFQS